MVCFIVIQTHLGWCERFSMHMSHGDIIPLCAKCDILCAIFVCYQVESHECIALKVSIIFHDIARNQNRNEALYASHFQQDG